MENSIFRQKNIDRINSPESLNDYVKVTNPSVWVILVGIVLLILGAFIFGAFGTIDTNINVAISAKNGITTAYIDENDISQVSEDIKVKINGMDYSLNDIPSQPTKAENIDEYVLHKANMESSEWLFPATVDGALEDGVYVGTITTDQASLISYIFN